MAILRRCHQIWIGKKEIPAREKHFHQLMKARNPEWEVTLHGNELLTRYAKDPYISWMLGTNEKWAFITDRLRVLLLRDEGGVYLDVDCEPIRPLNTLKFWDVDFVDFAYGTRSPGRPSVALHRGPIAFVDNTFLASKPHGRLISKLVTLWTPERKVVNGYKTGIEVIQHADWTTINTGVNPFYSMENNPQVICLHDHHNLSSWTDETTRQKPRASHPQILQRNAS